MCVCEREREREREWRERERESGGREKRQMGVTSCHIKAQHHG